MRVGDLRAFVARLDLPDDAPVLITGRHSLHVARAEVQPIHPVNQYGQAQMDPMERDGLSAVVFIDESTG